MARTRPKAGRRPSGGVRLSARPDDIRADLLEWERTYNTIRPHQALSYLTPAEYLASVGVDV